MKKETSEFDKWSARIKDILIIGASIACFLSFGVKFYMIPGIQAAQAKELLEHEEKLIQHDKQIAVLISGISDIKDLIRRTR